MRRGDFIFPALILLMAAVLLLLGAFYYRYPYNAFAFPLGSGLILCGFCIYELFRVLTGRSQTVPVDPDDPTVTLSLPSLGWMFALLPLLFGFGFVFGSAAYLLVCLWANGFSWRISIGSAVVAIAVTWGLFIKVFGMLLPIQPLWMG